MENKPSILYFNINLKYVDHMTTLCNLELLFNKQMYDIQGKDSHLKHTCKALKLKFS